MRERPIYFDIQATTPLDPRVLEEMLPYFTEKFGNAASRHAFGSEASEAVLRARASIAKGIGAKSPLEVVFTSGATEADNLAVKGLARANAERGRHVVTTRTEHKAVLDSCKQLEAEGFRVTYLEVDSDGLLKLDELAQAVVPGTVLVSIIAVNNEIGVIQDIAAIGAICRERGALFHTDATQAVGKIPFDVDRMNVDSASFTAHKMYGPKGVGALYLRRRNPEAKPEAEMLGGGHENGSRSGTLNVPGIVGLAAALRYALEDLEPEIARLTALRDRLKDGLRSGIENVRINGHETQRLPGNLNACFPGAPAELIQMALPDLALSGGSACSSGIAGPSHVLHALGSEAACSEGAVRIGLGRFTTQEDVDYAIGRFVEVVPRVRAEAARAGA